MPPAVQNSLKEWIAARDEVTKPLAREFIILFRKTLTERGIPLDRGHRDLNRLLEVRSIQDGALTEPQGTTYRQPDDEKHRIEKGPGGMQDETDTPHGEVNVLKHRNYTGGVSRGGYNMNRGSKSKGRPQACFLCGDTRHFQRKCPRQFCQHCGKQGHDRRDCYSNRQVLMIDPQSTTTQVGMTPSQVSSFARV